MKKVFDEIPYIEGEHIIIRKIRQIFTPVYPKRLKKEKRKICKKK